MKQNNYSITKEMKEVVIGQLVYNTMKPRIDELGIEAHALNTGAWLYYEEKVEALCGIPARQWPELVRLGVARSKTRVECSGTNGDVRYTDEALALYRRLKSRGGKLFQYVDQVRRYHQYVTFCFVHPSVALDIDFDALPFGSAERDCPHGKNADKILRKFNQLLHEAATLEADLWQVMNPIRRYNRLAELLPEAAKLMKPRPGDTNIIPVSLVEGVRERLAAGRVMQ